MREDVPEYLKGANNDKGKWFQKRCNKVKNAPKKRVIKNKTDPNDLEAAVQKECMALLKQLGIPAWRQNSGEINTGTYVIKLAPAGASDAIGILPDGRMLAVEFKRRRGGTQSDDQKKFQTMIENNNGVYLLSRSATELYEQLQEYI